MVTVGIDAHKSSLAVALVDELGREIGHEKFANDPDGHRVLYRWVERLAPGERRFGLESSGWLARSLARFLLEQDEELVDVRGSLTERERRRMRGQGKSDPRDAVAIARITAREQLPPVRVESPSRDLKLLIDYRAQLVAERIRTANRLHVDLVSLRPGYENQVRTLSSGVRLDRAERLLAGDKTVQAVLARRRVAALRRVDQEIKQLERELKTRVRESGSGLPRIAGVGDLIAARIIGEVGDVRRIANRHRFARMNGTAPIPASSGQTTRHRLNKGGNRRLNHALHMIALTQARTDPRARAYVDRRRSQGHTRRDAVRALKRHLSDVVYQQLRADAGLRPDADARPA